MNLGDYQTLKNDVLNYMENLIRNYDMKVSTLLPLDIEPEVILENDKCLIKISTVDTFPREGVTFYFYKKNDNKLLEIRDEELLMKHQISKKQFAKDCIELFDEFLIIELNNEFGNYHKDLMGIQKIIEKYYLPLIYENINSI
jgi:ferredoxin-fold anticodon binding domain-containing protein